MFHSEMWAQAKTVWGILADDHYKVLPCITCIVILCSEASPFEPLHNLTYVVPKLLFNALAIIVQY